jgi:hypothetical protein
MVKIETWQNGQLRGARFQEFVEQLRYFARLADGEFCFRSDPVGQIAERLEAAADLIEALTTIKKRQRTPFVFREEE